MFNLRLSSYLILYFLLTGCASFEKISDSAPISEKPQMSDSAEQSAKRVKNAVENVEQIYKQAKTENYEYYAPGSWKNTNFKIKAMKKLIRQFEPDNQGFFGGPSEKTIMTAILQAQGSISKAGKTKTLTTDFLSDIFADIDYLQANIDNKWRQEFNEVTTNVNNLILLIEQDGDTFNYQSDRTELRLQLQKFEIQMATDEYYTPLQQSLAKLDNTLIPQSHNKAELKLAQLNNTITKYPRDNKKIQQAAGITSDYISLAHFILTDVKWINSLNDSQTESVVIRYRSAIEALSRKILDRELPPLAFNNQVSELENAILAKFMEADAHIQAVKTETSMPENASAKIN